MDLKKLGWDSNFDNNFIKFKKGDNCVGRISYENRGIYNIYTEHGELVGEISGKMRYEYEGDFPAVGDWVVITPRLNEGSATIHHVLPRKSKFSRKVAGTIFKEQVVASNVDVVFIVTALNQNFNIRRIERYLTLAWESGAAPVIVLSKADLCEDYEAKLYEIEKVAVGVPIHAVSAVTGFGVETLSKYLSEGKTTVLLGSSGVGKSTLVNLLMGYDVQEVKEISGVRDKGRHTTTSRQMVILPSGAVLIDTPGMRELQLWDGSEGIGHVFDDIESLSKGCKFINCKHEKEPGCAIRSAIEEGILQPERLESYLKLQRELKYFEKKQAHIQRMSEKKVIKNGPRNKKLKELE